MHMVSFVLFVLLYSYYKSLGDSTGIYSLGLLPWRCGYCVIVALWSNHLKLKSREISFGHKISFSYRIVLKYCTEHGSIVLCTNFQNIWTTETDVMGERDFGALNILGATTRFTCHYNDVIMGAMASQITSLKTLYSSLYSGADQRKHRSSASLDFVRGIHRWPVNSPHKGPVTRKCFHLMTSSW